MSNQVDIQHEQKGHSDLGKKVTVKIDRHEIHISKGTYKVNELKALAGVDLNKELDQIIHGQLTPLDDESKVVIKGGEEFISHARAGGSA